MAQNCRFPVINSSKSLMRILGCTSITITIMTITMANILLKAFSLISMASLEPISVPNVATMERYKIKGLAIALPLLL